MYDISKMFKYLVNLSHLHRRNKRVVYLLLQTYFFLIQKFTFYLEETIHCLGYFYKSLTMEQQFHADFVTCILCFLSNLCLTRDIWRFSRAGQRPNTHHLGLSECCNKHLQILLSFQFSKKSGCNMVNNIFCTQPCIFIQLYRYLGFP